MSAQFYPEPRRLSIEAMGVESAAGPFVLFYYQRLEPLSRAVMRETQTAYSGAYNNYVLSFHGEWRHLSKYRYKILYPRKPEKTIAPGNYYAFEKKDNLKNGRLPGAYSHLYPFHAGEYLHFPMWTATACLELTAGMWQNSMYKKDFSKVSDIADLAGI